MFSRACSWELEGSNPKACRYETYTPGGVRIIDCETCTYDGCNGDSNKVVSIYNPYEITTTEGPTTSAGEGVAASWSVKSVGVVMGLMAYLWV